MTIMIIVAYCSVYSNVCVIVVYCDSHSCTYHANGYIIQS